MNTKEKLQRLAEAPESELYISRYHWAGDGTWTVKLECKAKDVKVALQAEDPDFDIAVDLAYDKFMNLGDIVTRDLQAPMIEPPKAPVAADDIPY